MIRQITCATAIMLLGCSTHLEPQTPFAVEAFITWNVGQGLWTTWVQNDRCYHFDAGGERAPWRAIKATCGKRQNIFSFSHWDMDHIDFVAKAARRLGNSCVLNMPQGSANAHKQLLFKGIRPCGLSEPLIVEIDHLPRRTSRNNHSNDLSRVFVIKGQITAPGDSTAHEEKDWASRARGRLLILGHHGSRTSTSEWLLSNLHGLKQAIASCRKARYGHPHAEVLTRLKKHGVAAITTEDWGTIVWQSLPDNPYGR